MKPSEAGELTRAQTTQMCGLGFAGAYSLASPLPATYETYRTIRKDPTIALARIDSIAPILAGEWSVQAAEDVDEERIKFIQDQFVPMREHIMETALLGGIDFGWQGFEKVFQHRDGRVVLTKLKPLLHDLTTILIDESTGAFAGFEQSRDNLQLSLDKSLLVSFRVEGTQWYGQSLLENLRLTHNEWTTCNATANRYEEKLAGAHLHVSYPPGTSTYKGVPDVDNAEIAADFITNFEASSGFQTAANDMPDAPGWSIDILQDSGGREAQFIDRLKYLDTLKIRGLLMPERAMIEGQFGTKAEAGEHIDLAFTMMELADRYVTRMVNWHAVDQILALNFNDEARGSVWLQSAPLADVSIAYLRSLYLALVTNPSGFLEEYGTLDTRALKDQLSIPRQEEEAGLDSVLKGLPLPGMDPNDPAAATVRRMYAEVPGGNGEGI